MRWLIPIAILLILLIGVVSISLWNLPAEASAGTCPWLLSVIRPETGVYHWEIFAENFQQNTRLPHSSWVLLESGSSYLDGCLHCTRLLATGNISDVIYSRAIARVRYPTNPGTGEHLNRTGWFVVNYAAGFRGCRNARKFYYEVWR